MYWYWRKQGIAVESSPHKCYITADCYIYMAWFRQSKGAIYRCKCLSLLPGLLSFTLTLQIKRNVLWLSTHIFVFQLPKTLLFYLTLKSATCPEVNLNANTAWGETLQNVNCSSAVDLLIILPRGILLWAMSPWLVRSWELLLQIRKTKYIVIVDHLRKPLGIEAVDYWLRL